MSHTQRTWGAGPNTAITWLNAIETDLAALNGITSALGDAFTLASSASAGATSITLDRDPTPRAANLGYILLEPYSVNCELRKVTAAAGTVLTLATVKTQTSSRLQFIAATKTIRLSRGITTITGSAGTVTVTCDTDHPFSVSDSVAIYGTTNFNGTYTVASVNHGAKQFTFASATTGTENAGSVRNSSDATLITFFKDYNVAVTGSASNNGNKTVNRTFRHSHDGGWGSDPWAFTVAETLVDENAGGGTSSTLTVGLNSAHASGAVAVWLPAAIVHAAWYGCLYGVSDSTSATTNTKALQRAINDLYSQSVGGTLFVDRALTVNDEIWLETRTTLRGHNPDVSSISATVNGSPTWASGGFPSGEVCVIHSRRDGDPVPFAVAGASPRLFVYDILIGGGSIYGQTGTDGVTNGTNTFTSAGAAFTSADIGKLIGFVDTTGALFGCFQRKVTAVASATSLTFDGPVVAAGTGLRWYLGGANGVLASPQQPANWANVRIQGCLGYGMTLTDVQQFVMRNMEFATGNGVSLRYRGVQMCWAYDFDSEQTLIGDFISDVYPDGSPTTTNANTFTNMHSESTPNTNFQIECGVNWRIVSPRITNVATGAFINSPSGRSYTIEDGYFTTNSPTYFLIKNDADPAVPAITTGDGPGGENRYIQMLRIRGAEGTGSSTSVIYNSRTGFVVGAGGVGLVKRLAGSKTYDPASTIDGATWTTTVTVTGATVASSVARAAHSSITAAGWILYASVTSADTVTVVALNKTGGTVDLASGTLTAVVEVLG